MISVTNIRQNQWIKACKRLGLVVDTKRGKGSHIRVFHPSKSKRPITIPSKTYKVFNQSLYKTLLEWGFEEDEIDKALK